MLKSEWGLFMNSLCKNIRIYEHTFFLPRKRTLGAQLFPPRTGVRGVQVTNKLVYIKDVKIENL